MKRLYAELFVYALVAAAGVVSILQVAPLETRMPFDVGPKAFPAGMAAAMIVLALIGAVRSVAGRSEDVLDVPGFGKIAVTLGATVALFGLWSLIGHFFLLAFVYLAGLLLFYFSDGPISRRLVVWVLLASAVFCAGAHFAFTEIIYTKF